MLCNNITHVGDDVGAALELDLRAQLGGRGHAEGNGRLGEDDLGDLCYITCYVTWAVTGVTSGSGRGVSGCVSSKMAQLAGSGHAEGDVRLGEDNLGDLCYITC
jgi:hypothetical protein